VILLSVKYKAHSSGDKQLVLYGLACIAPSSEVVGPSINHDECVLSAGVSLQVDQIYLTITVLITQKWLRNQPLFLLYHFSICIPNFAC
jgi:hypothetical protein